MRKNRTGCGREGPGTRYIAEGWLDFVKGMHTPGNTERLIRTM